MIESSQPSEEATGNESAPREERANQIYDENVSTLGKEHAPTLPQIRFALNLNIDPRGKYRQELSDLIGGVRGKQEQEQLTRQMRAYLSTLYPEDMRAVIEQMEPSVLQQKITAREDELMQQFPIGSYINFGEKNGIIGGYFDSINSDFRSHCFGLRTGKGGKGSNYSFKHLLNARRVTEFVDAQAAAMPALEERITQRVKALLTKIEFIDLSTATRRTKDAVMRVVKPKARAGTLNPATITDDEIDNLIGKFEGKTY